MIAAFKINQLLKAAIATTILLELLVTRRVINDFNETEPMTLLIQKLPYDSGEQFTNCNSADCRTS